MRSVSCDFCFELEGQQTSAWARRFPNTDRQLWASENWQVVPTLGPLSELHFLVIPVRHTTAFRFAADSEVNQADEIFEGLSKSISSAMLGCVMFEHGSEPDNPSGGCGITHAHMHIVGVDAVWEGAPDDGNAWRYAGERSFPRAGLATPYLLFRDTNGHWWERKAVELPSQWMRKLVAARQNAEWDWRREDGDRLLPDLIPRMTEVVARALK
jgi:diadenosine tetraphosphate (Ap4A) HIT family hydrolase